MEGCLTAFFVLLLVLFFVAGFEYILLGSAIIGGILLVVGITCKYIEIHDSNLALSKQVWLRFRRAGLKSLDTDEDYKLADEINKDFDEDMKKKHLKLFQKVLRDKELVKNLELEYQKEVEQKRKREEAAIKRKLTLEEKAKKEKIAKEKKEYIDKSNKIYNKCIELGLTSFDTDEDIKSLGIVGKTFEVEDIELAKEMYYKAMEIKEIEKELEKLTKLKKLEEQKLKKLEELKKEEKKIFDKAKNTSETIGKERYSKSLNKLSNKLIDFIDNVDDYLDIKVVGYECTFVNNLKINFSCSLKKNIEIIGKKGILDGSFKVSVLDGDKVIATGYLNGYESSSLKCFKNKHYDVLCIGKNIEKDKEYKIELEPLSFWIIEE